MPHKTFTVFTPTYQRRSTLPRVYASLRDQTNKDFEWLIVDDGSTDGTEHLVQQWQQTALFPIRYRFQQNAGKHVAFNHGVGVAKGRFFLTLDSDDSCVPEALERLKHWWDSIPPERRGEFSGVTVHCRDETGRIVGTLFPASPLDSNSAELRLKYRVKGEKWGFQRTDVLRKFPFPEPVGVRFVAESVVWRMVGKKYHTRYVNEILRVYWSGDHLCKEGAPRLSTISRDVLRGRLMYHLQTLNEFSHLFWHNPLAFLGAASNVFRYASQLGVAHAAMFRDLDSNVSKALVIAMIPVGAAYAIRDVSRRRRA